MGIWIKFGKLKERFDRRIRSINQYQERVSQSNYEEIKHIIEYIRDEEKEHIAELVQPIRKLDNAQEEKFQWGSKIKMDC